MLTKMRLKNFKSWRDTTDIRLAPLTGFFGTNSSGKTSLLQALVLAKQTVEARNRNVVLSTKGAFIDVGTPMTLIHGRMAGQIGMEIAWQPIQPVEVKKEEVTTGEIGLSVEIRVGEDGTMLDRLIYTLSGFVATLQRKQDELPLQMGESYDVTVSNEGEIFSKRRGKPRSMYGAPVSFYGFPPDAVGDFDQTIYLDAFESAFVEQFYEHVLYLGPLREYPERTYSWAGDKPSSIGVKGQQAIPALLASQNDVSFEQNGTSKRKKSIKVIERINHWLKEMGLANEFTLQPISKGRPEHEILIQRVESGVRVPITDVGFGISQILPVLVLLYTCKPHSTLIFEQPEIHLHPRAQTVLADALYDAIEHRGIQIILESHSEHLLRRLQLRIAEGKIPLGNTAFYFCDNPSGESRITPLDLDPYGQIRNWPQDFFGDLTGDMLDMMEAGLERKLKRDA